mmetsp:Transcript_4408/g.6425  ORF Transcript_4408/g.6425 Transcript_4408/m.6425 type:complete len:294 (+) Transcript_4408:187-1068(+)
MGFGIAEKDEEDFAKDILDDADKSQPSVGLNESEKAFLKLCKDLDIQKNQPKYDHNHYELINFGVLDNNLIDSVYSNILTLNQEMSKRSDDMLIEQELIHHLRKIARELDYILDFPFSKFWAYLVKFPLFMSFLDDFLQNLRKYNDLEKITIDLDQSMNDSKMTSSGDDIQLMLRKQVSKTLRSVFKIFFRISQNMESDSEYFSIDFYRRVINKNNFIDIAKLLDIAAIYGSSNPEQVKLLATTVFETVPKVENEFKEAFDMMLNIFKRIFKDAMRTDQMIRGDAILQKSKSE